MDTLGVLMTERINGREYYANGIYSEPKGTAADGYGDRALMTRTQIETRRAEIARDLYLKSLRKQLKGDA